MTIPLRPTGQTVNEAFMLGVANRLNCARSTSTTGVVAGVGMSLNSLLTYTTDDGEWMWFQVSCNLTLSLAVNAATGNVADTTVATLPARCRGNVADTLYLCGGGSRTVAGTYRPSTGVVTLTSTTGTVDLAVGETIVLGGWVPLTV